LKIYQQGRRTWAGASSVFCDLYYYSIRNLLLEQKDWAVYKNVTKVSHIINFHRVVQDMKKDYTMKMWP